MSSCEIYNFKNFKNCIFNPLRTKGGGKLIFTIQQKSLCGPKILVESFITQASKLTILKINPITLVTLAARGEEIEFGLLCKKSYIYP